ncbi:uncharacterized protein AruCF_1475 [Achromobacter ruhlandii]|nr:uncharacterized protein AruCF_1475 [Achromobacter ruhlandii]
MIKQGGDAARDARDEPATRDAGSSVARTTTAGETIFSWRVSNSGVYDFL